MNVPALYVHQHTHTLQTRAFMQTTPTSPLSLPISADNTDNMTLSNTRKQQDEKEIIELLAKEADNSSRVEQHTQIQMLPCHEFIQPHTLVDLKSNLAECQAVTDENIKQNEPIAVSQNQNSQNVPSYYIGDDDDQISDSGQQEIDGSDSEESEQKDQEQAQEQDQEEDSGSEEAQQQSDEDLELDQVESDEVDSDDQEEGEDQYPSDYDSDSNEQIDSFENLFQQAADLQSGEQTQQQFLDRYQNIKQALESEQLAIKQEQAIFGIAVPLELQMRKTRVSQGLLNLINNNYVKRLHIDSVKRRKQSQQRNQQPVRNSQAECSVHSEQETEQQGEAEVEKAVKKVIFRDNIQMKMYKKDEQVNIIKETQQFNELLNNCQKGMKRYIALTPIRNFCPPQPTETNRPRLNSCADIIVQPQTQLEKTNCKPQTQTQSQPGTDYVNVGAAENDNESQLSEDCKSNFTSSSQQKCEKQQFMFQQINPGMKSDHTGESTFIRSDIQMRQMEECKQDTEGRQFCNQVYFSKDCLEQHTQDGHLVK